MLITNIYNDQEGLKHIAPFNASQTYCGKPVNNLKPIDKAAPTGEYCRLCSIKLGQALLNEKSELLAAAKEYLRNPDK